MLNGLTRLVASDDPAALRAGFVWLYGFIRPRGRAILGLLALSLLASMLVLLQPWLTKMLIDDGLLAGDHAQLVLIAGSMVLAGVAGTALAGLNRYLHTHLSGSILFALRGDVYQHLQRLSPAFFARRSTGDLLSRIDGDVAEIQRFALDSLFATVSSVVGLLGALMLMVALSWQLSLLVLVLIPLEVLWLRWMRRKVTERTRSVRERSAALSGFLVETLPATKFIQTAGQTSRASAQLGVLNRDYLRDLLRLQLTEFFTHAVPGTLTSLTRAVAFLIGGWWVIEGQWQLGALIAFSTYLGMATGPVNSLLGLYVAVQRMSVSLARVSELRQAPVAVSSPTHPQVLPQPLRGAFVFQEVGFAHDAQAGRVLDKVSLCIPAGARVALRGPSGAGKSSFIDLLLRHYDPEEGRILFDGIDLRALDLLALRRALAVVSQDIVLFRGSVAENVRYARPEADDEAVRQALEQACLGDWLASLPQGLDTPLAERGQSLSGGQRQRIAIARALLQDPAVLILDEATSAVDAETEGRIIATVDQLFASRTRILVSHRASALQGCDLELVLEHGHVRIVEGGAAPRAMGPDSDG